MSEEEEGETAKRTMLTVFELLVKSGSACENAAKVISVTRELEEISTQMSGMLEKVVRPCVRPCIGVRV